MGASEAEESGGGVGVAVGRRSSEKDEAMDGTERWVRMRRNWRGRQ